MFSLIRWYTSVFPYRSVTLELDTALVTGTLVKEENGIRVTVTKSGDRIQVKTETLPDSVKAVVKLQNKYVTVTTKAVEVYEERPTLIKRIVQGLSWTMTAGLAGEDKEIKAEA